MLPEAPPPSGHRLSRAGARLSVARVTSSTPSAPKTARSRMSWMRTVAMARKPMAVVSPDSAMGRATICASCA